MLIIKIIIITEVVEILLFVILFFLIDHFFGLRKCAKERKTAKKYTALALVIIFVLQKTQIVRKYHISSKDRPTKCVVHFLW